MADPRELLMSEVDSRVRDGRAKNHVESWRQVLELPRKPDAVAIERNADARARSFRETALDATQAGLLRLSEGRSIPGTSVQKARPTRGGPPVGPDPTRKPGESQEDFRVRLRKQILDLGKRANNAPAAPDDTASYSERKTALINDPDTIAREVSRNARRGAPAPSTDALTAKAHKLMQSRKQAIDPRSAGFSENFKAALADLQ